MAAEAISVLMTHRAVLWASKRDLFAWDLCITRVQFCMDLHGVRFVC
jgi:hypothetical protein